MNKDYQDLLNKMDRKLLTLYSQIESLTWLSKALNLSGSLPPLRSWATSPDILLRLHEYIRLQRPRLIVECGSGASTIVIADALRQNGKGKLISLEHAEKYGSKTRDFLIRERLSDYVDLRVMDMKPWHLDHMSDEEELWWYDTSLTEDIDNVDLLLVDGPPGKTCKYARYPSMEVFAEKLTANSQVWMDDTIRQEEVDICDHWCKKFGFESESFPLEKGLYVLCREGVEKTSSKSYPLKEIEGSAAEFSFTRPLNR